MLLDLNNKEKSEVPYEFFILPDGSPHFKLTPLDSSGEQYEITLIKCSLCNMDDLAKLLWAFDAVGRSIDYEFSDAYLQIPYFFCARQDRLFKNEAFSAKIVCDLIEKNLPSTLGGIEVLHPHSDTVPNNLGNLSAPWTHEEFVDRTVEDFKPDGIIIPDQGAYKTSRLYDKYKLPHFQCLKIRNPKTGKIDKVELCGETPKGKRLLLIDDIGAGMYPFIKTAELFPENELALFLTHSIFSNRENLKAITKLYSRIYTTNSYHYSGFPVEIDDLVQNNVTVYKV
jgi:phosphoribosylpyrophosphate synthetase